MITVNINSIDRTSQITAGSLYIENILTNKKDTCRFSMTINSTKVLPIIGQDVTAYLGATKVFGGVITEINKSSINQGVMKLDITCCDYSRLLDKRLVADTYQNMTVNDIIADLQTNYMPAGFTIANVNCVTVIKYIAFNYLTITKCLEQLATYVGYDFYIDYDKDIHFFSPEVNPAPIDIEDSNNSYIPTSLKINKDNSQVRNSIVVRGGEYLADSFTTNILANGTNVTYPLPYKYNNLSVTVNGSAKTVGIDYIDDPNSFDLLFNFQEKILRWRTNNKPSNGQTIAVTGRPYLPVIVKLKSPVDIANMASQEGGDGVYEYLVIDKSIDSKEGARQRALAEIKTYSATLSEGEFTTRYVGFKAGQKIHINSVSRNVDEYFIINKVTLADYDKDNFIYRVSLVTTRSFDLIDLLSKMITDQTKTIDINPNEIIDLVEAVSEEITMTDIVTASKVHNPQVEAISLVEVFTPQALNYAVEFVLGVYDTPTGTKRVFCLDMSPLG